MRQTNILLTVSLIIILRSFRRFSRTSKSLCLSDGRSVSLSVSLFLALSLTHTQTEGWGVETEKSGRVQDKPACKKQTVLEDGRQT